MTTLLSTNIRCIDSFSSVLEYKNYAAPRRNAEQITLYHLDFNLFVNVV
uniref:Uncharacterized protein n=1 Tax=Romanomermis culicivorax TaxID=13658 RepID=A0A915L497_ROMCU